MNVLTAPMIEHMNLRLKSDGSALRYVIEHEDVCNITYRIVVDDPRVENSYMRVKLTDEFEKWVRDFLLEYGVKDTGYSNTVETLFVNKYLADEWNGLDRLLKKKSRSLEGKTEKELRRLID